jgi:hypothetical protein
MVLIWLAVGVYVTIEGQGRIVLFLVFCGVVTTTLIFGIGWLLSKKKK